MQAWPSVLAASCHLEEQQTYSACHTCKQLFGVLACVQILSAYSTEHWILNHQNPRGSSSICQGHLRDRDRLGGDWTSDLCNVVRLIQRLRLFRLETNMVQFYLENIPYPVLRVRKTSLLSRESEVGVLWFQSVMRAIKTSENRSKNGKCVAVTLLRRKEFFSAVAFIGIGGGREHLNCNPKEHDAPR